MIRRIFRLPELPLLLAPFVLLSPVWLTGQALFWGTPVLQFVPWRVWAWESLRAGHLPLWNPLLGMGAPLIANYQSGLFYPPHWIYLLLTAIGGASLLAWGQALLVAFHLTLASLGMARLGRRLGLNPLAQTVCGLAFGLSDYLVARAGFLSINAAVAWLPWIVLAVTPRPSIVRLAVCIALQLLAGHAQTTWYTLLLTGIWGVYWALASPPVAVKGQAGDGGGDRLAHSQFLSSRAGLLVGLLLAIVLGIALAAVQIFPTLEYLIQSQRGARVDYDFAMTYSFWPWRFLTLLAPHFFGDPMTGDYWGYGNYWEDAVYVGLLPLLLAASALLSRRWKDVWGAISPRPPRAFRGFLLGLILLSFTLALGKNTPIFPWLYRHVPTFDMFQAPTRFSLWAVFSLSLLAGSGAQLCRRPAGRGLYWTRLGTAGACAVTIGAGLAWLLLGDVSPSFVRATALAGFWGAMAGVLWLLTPLDKSTPEPPGLQRGWWGWAVVLILGADLIVAGWGSNPSVDLMLYRDASPSPGRVRSMVEDGRIFLPSADEEHLRFDRFFRFDTFQSQPGEINWRDLRAVMLPNINLLEEVASANNFDPIVPARYARWMETLNQADAQTQERMLNLMSVNVVEREDVSLSSGVRYQRWETLPRFHWAQCARLAESGDAALKQVTMGKWDPATEVVLEAESSRGLLCAEGESPSGGSPSVRVVNESPNRLEVQLQADSAGYLVVADVWYPGWLARLDGESTSILRANYLFRAVSVPAGSHNIVFAYRPIWFYLGAVMSGLAWAVIFFWRWRLKGAAIMSQ